MVWVFFFHLFCLFKYMLNILNKYLSYLLFSLSSVFHALAVTVHLTPYAKKPTAASATHAQHHTHSSFTFLFKNNSLPLYEAERSQFLQPAVYQNISAGCNSLLEVALYYLLAGSSCVGLTPPAICLLSC